METVLYFQSPSKTSTPDKIAGVRRYAAIANWHIQVLEELPSSKSVQALCEFWNPIGAIIECGGGYHDINPDIFNRIPTVYLDRNPLTLPQDVSCISHDSVATGRLAAKELLVAGHPNFAYVPYPQPRFWSEDRERGFVEALKLNGRDCAVFTGKGSLQSISWQKSLRKWIETIAKPCSIFAANDNVAAEILTAAAQSGFDIPRDIAVCGVDNFTPVCEHSTPTLTSIQPDFMLAGELAARTLDDIIKRGKSSYAPVRLTFGPADIIRRASTRTSTRYDPEVAAAMELIRRHACEGISSADALTVFKCSRRMAEMRFRQTTGHSILDEIQTVRLDKAKGLLAKSQMDMAAIANFCGFSSAKAFWKFFRQKTGVSPSQWRTKNMRQQAPKILNSLKAQ
jgi:LacI family transcriptional regulator